MREVLLSSVSSPCPPPTLLRLSVEKPVPGARKVGAAAIDGIVGTSAYLADCETRLPSSFLSLHFPRYIIVHELYLT